MNERIIGDDTLSATSNCKKKEVSWSGFPSFVTTSFGRIQNHLSWQKQKSPFNWPSRLATNLKGTPNKKPPQKQFVWQNAVEIHHLTNMGTNWNTVQELLRHIMKPMDWKRSPLPSSGIDVAFQGVCNM